MPIKANIIHEEKELAGLQDGGHVILRCSRCNKPLVDFFITRPQEKDPSTGKVWTWRFQAKCCYCGDKSYIKTIYGGFHLGIITHRDPRTGKEVEDVLRENMIPHPEHSDVILINTIKAASHE